MEKSGAQGKPNSGAQGPAGGASRRATQAKDAADDEAAEVLPDVGDESDNEGGADAGVEDAPPLTAVRTYFRGNVQKPKENVGFCL